MTSEREAAFRKLQDALATQADLAVFDPPYDTAVHTDASYFAAGFMITQTNPISKIERPVVLHSFKFGGAQLNYPIHDKELMPVVVAVQKYRWMFGGTVQIYTDHQALLYFSRTTEIFGARRADTRKFSAGSTSSGITSLVSQTLLLTPCHDGLTCPQVAPMRTHPSLHIS